MNNFICKKPGVWHLNIKKYCVLNCITKNVVNINKSEDEKK